ncbi:MAG: lipopolysaccharide biosynthesis protein [Neptuniibacter sp.]
MRGLFINNQFARGVGVLVGGTAAAQALALLAAPILTRLFTPEEFGVLAVYIGILSLIGVVASLKYELAIPVPEDESEVVVISILSLILVSVISLLFGLSLYFFGEQLFAELNVPVLSDYIWCLPIGLFFIGIFQVFNYLAVRFKEFPLISKTKVKQQLVMVGLQIVLFKLGSIGLILGYLCGKAIGAILLSKKLVSRLCWDECTFTRLKHIALKYKNYSKFTSWGALFNAAGTQIPALLFATAFGAGAAGLYALSHRIVGLPMGVVGQAVSQVFLSDAAGQFRKGTLATNAQYAQRALIKVIMPPVIILIIYAPYIFEFTFGSYWRESGEIASWLALWMLVSFSTSPLSSIFTITENQALGMLMQVNLFIFRILGLGIGVFCNDFMLGVICFSIFNIFGYVFYQVAAFYCLRVSVWETMKGYVFTIPIVLLAFVLARYSPINYLAVLFAFLMVFSSYYYYKLALEFKYEGR